MMVLRKGRDVREKGFNSDNIECDFREEEV